MTTLDNTEGLAERLADAAAIFDRIQAQEGNNIDGDSEPHWSSQIEALAGAKACRDAIDALSSLPAQAGNGFLTDGPADPDQYAAYVAQELKRPLAERLRLITHVGPYHLRNTPNEAAAALVAPSQPAAVGVTDEMVEAAMLAIMPWLNWKPSAPETIARAALEAALAHRDQVKL